LRCGEFADKDSSYLKISDIAFENDNSNFTLNLASSKTDVFREGVKVIITANNSLVCPVHYMRQYRDLRLCAGAKPHDPVFLNSHGSVLTMGYFVRNLKKILQKTGHDSHLYTGHSFRIGAATKATRVGIPDHLIQTLGRWSSDSYLRYIRVDPKYV
jgi:site-specific recombinase XerD